MSTLSKLLKKHLSAAQQEELATKLAFAIEPYVEGTVDFTEPGHELSVKDAVTIAEATDNALTPQEILDAQTEDMLKAHGVKVKMRVATTSTVASTTNTRRRSTGSAVKPKQPDIASL